MESVAEVLCELVSRKNLTLEDLQGNDVFVDTVLQATQAAVRTSQQENFMHCVTRSSILHCRDRRTMSYNSSLFPSLDEFLPWHLRLLALFDDPRKWFRENNKRWPSDIIAGGLSTVLEAAYPELQSRSPFSEWIVKGLFDRGLLGINSLAVMMSSSGFEARRTTDIGRQFLLFISVPKRDAQ